MRVLIFGAKGQLGRDLTGVFSTTGEVQGYDLPELDIADSEAVGRVVNDMVPDLVINAAAYTDVEGAEDNREAAFAANEAGARTVAQAAAGQGLPVVYYSTDYVFDGAKGSPYEPADRVAPLGVYAQSKEAGERATREVNPEHFIVRTAWLYGPGGNNFVEKILRAASAHSSLRVVEDEVGSPTHTLDLAEATCALVGTTAFGTYHAVNAGQCSRFEYARRILELAGVDTPIEPCDSSEFPTKAPRPENAILSNAALEAASGYVMRPWQDALAQYMQRRKTQK
jgi:dTDP-4-dehydrorhamnose reductase